jgi:glycosyltransferase involved in cell wall biosynthesis
MTKPSRVPCPAVRPTEPEGGPEVSVVIPALNEELMIGRCLEALATLDFPREAFEVIVVDNGSADRTVQVAGAFAGRLRLTVLERPGVRVSAVRNQGAAAARGRILAFLDADCIPPRHWLTAALEHFRQHPRSVIGAPYRPPPDSSWVATTWELFRERHERRSVTYVSTAGMFLGRSDFLTVGGFDDNLDTAEDWELCARLREAGVPVAIVPETAVVHLETPQTLVSFFRQERQRGKDVLRVSLRGMGKARSRKAVAFTVFTAACLAGTALGAGLALFARRFELLAVSLIGLLLPPLALGFREARAAGRWSQWLPLSLLFLVYGTARAASLLDAPVKPGKASHYAG